MMLLSLGIGIAVGLFSALLTHKIKPFKKKEYTNLQLMFLFLMAYLSYILSAYVNAPGSVSTFSCAFVMNHYTYHNLNKEAQ